MVFKKKDEPTKENKRTLEDICGDTKPDIKQEYEIAHALQTLRKAIHAGQIYCNRHSVTDVVFGIAKTKEQVIAEEQRRGGRAYEVYDINRVTYASPLDELYFKDAAKLKREKVESLKQKLADAQESQKKKVEEIESLSKQLGELE